MDKLVNIILGADNGQFTIYISWFKGRKHRVKKNMPPVPANKPEEVLATLRKVVREIGPITNFMCSSSIDFPTEYGVSRKQVDKLLKILDVEGS